MIDLQNIIEFLGIVLLLPAWAFYFNPVESALAVGALAFAVIPWLLESEAT